MAKVIDVRGSDNQFIIEGGALVLPTANNTVSAPIDGSIRYNAGNNELQMCVGGVWAGQVSAGAVTSFNSRTGGVTLTSSDVTTALGYTPLSGTLTLSGAVTGSGTSSITTAFAAITNNRILANVSGGTAAPIANTLTAIIDSISSTQGVILYRGASTWTPLAPATSGQLLQTQGVSANPQWHTLGYPDVPTEIQNSLAQVSIAGQPPSNTKAVIMAIVQNTQVPANFAGSAGYSGTNATATSAFTVSYIHSGSPTTIGTFTFSSAGHTPTLSTQAAVNLVSGDVLIITTPSVIDATLADVGITLLLLKQ